MHRLPTVNCNVSQCHDATESHSVVLQCPNTRLHRVLYMHSSTHCQTARAGLPVKATQSLSLGQAAIGITGQKPPARRTITTSTTHLSHNDAKPSLHKSHTEFWCCWQQLPGLLDAIQVWHSCQKAPDNSCIAVCRQRHDKGLQLRQC